MAIGTRIIGNLKKEHWDVINYIRYTFKETGKCPLVYQTCQTNEFHLRQLKSLFPTGYLRGICRLSCITYKEGYLRYSWLQAYIEKATSGT